MSSVASARQHCRIVINTENTICSFSPSAAWSHAKAQGWSVACIMMSSSHALGVAVSTVLYSYRYSVLVPVGTCVPPGMRRIAGWLALARPHHQKLQSKRKKEKSVAGNTTGCQNRSKHAQYLSSRRHRQFQYRLYWLDYII